ncbi:MAG: prepilin-type N-terminal cleavage/methylation domain-containing protein [Rubrobacter sp.]|nr:prepilin-type N-terminal cleavage/methylation domain-containing protein [Rubrobacter sp.]
MAIKRRKHGGPLRDERGFTLPELLTTIAILGILLAIAIVVWNNIIEARRVDAAANQLASDMRLAHTRATNQLTDWRVVLAPEEGDGGPDYYLLKLSNSYDKDSDGTPTVERTIPRTFPANVEVSDHDPSLNDSQENDSWWPEDATGLPDQTRTLEFNSDGSMLAYRGPSGSVRVAIDEDPEREITFLAATSRVKLD